jgi:ABC-2 type transport system permease protein
MMTWNQSSVTWWGGRMKLDASLVGLRTMVQFSVRKLLLHRRWAIVVILTVLVAGVMGYIATQSDANISTASDMMNLLMLTFLLPVLALIYGASMIRNEIDDRSIIQVITSPLDRKVSYLGYYLSLAMVLSILLSIITAVGGTCFFLVNGWSDGATELILAFIAVQVIGAIAYSALFLVMGVALKQPMYLGLIYVFVWEGFVGSVPGAIGEYTIRHQLQVIASGLVQDGSIATMSGDGGMAMMILIALSIVFVAIGAYLFQNKEVM